MFLASDEASYVTGSVLPVGGGDQARVPAGNGIEGAGADKVWTGIALHTTSEIPLHMDPETALETRGVELDILGIGLRLHQL